jgi:predicted SnoaL-like aldol condensation-catalyzing enzyme
MTRRLLLLNSEEPTMLTIVNSADTRSVRNKDNMLALYELMINQQKPAEAAAKYLVPEYIQHDPFVANGADGLATYVGQLFKTNPKLHVKIHKIIALGDYVWAHVNFVYTDDPQDRGVAAVDIWRMNGDGKAVEHWDVFQEVPDPQKSANSNGMF